MITPKALKLASAGSAVVALSLFLSWFFKGPLGLDGMALGLFVSTFNLLALWGVISLMGTASSANPRPTLGSILLVFAFLVKLPVFVVGITYSRSLGGGAPTCFLAGVALVYSTLILWALARR